jgi:hypothetical protein
MNLEKNLRKEIQKKGKGAGAAGPTPPPFRPRSRPGLPLPPPLFRARTPASSQLATATWRPYAGDGRAAADGFTWSVRRPGLPGHSIRYVARASLLPPSARERNRSRRSSAVAPSPEQLRCSPPATPVPQPRRQNHQSTRRRRGKLLRTFYRGESPSSAVNSSLELFRARRSSPPRRILLFPPPFRSFFGALDQS